MVMIGYEAGMKAYRAYNPMNKKLVVTRDVLFEKEKSWNWSSVKPAKTISDEIFNVIYNDDLQHADNQHDTSMEDGASGSMPTTPVRSEEAAKGAASGGSASPPTHADETSASESLDASGGSASPGGSRCDRPDGPGYSSSPAVESHGSPAVEQQGGLASRRSGPVTFGME
jgi:hypothetical protein